MDVQKEKDICPFTALDARQIANEKQEKIKEAFLLQIQEHIFNAASVGKYRITFPDSDVFFEIVKTCKEILVSKGFKVDTYTKNYTHGVYISWEEKEEKKV